ncbi:hypothetical protein R1sor_019039 [Riccia sorocarpa]|uniref:Uncharacterized protein n=1 Tax=Riccia sorocarpa TaxID=122646 RepID=A0ABD3IE51_9MARC
MDVSITIGQVGSDVAVDIFNKVTLYIEKEAAMGLIAFDAETPTPSGGVICIKFVKTQGLHTVTGLIGYCLKDEDKQHFCLYFKNVSEKQMDDGRKRHIRFGVSGYKNRLELTPQNVLGRALQYRRYRSKNPVTISFRMCIREMVRLGQYMAGLKWLLSPSVLKVRAERLWMAAVQPETVSMADIDHMFFNFEQTDRYFKTLGAAATEQASTQPIPKRYTVHKPPELSEKDVESSAWTEPHPKDFIEVDLKTLDPNEMQRLLRAGYGLTSRTVVPEREAGSAETERVQMNPAEEFINFL